MSKVQGWTLSLLAVVALAAGVLMMSGAVSFAQEGTATPTPQASSGTDDGGTPTPAPDGSNDGNHNDRHCDHDKDSSDSGTSGTDTSL